MRRPRNRRLARSKRPYARGHYMAMATRIQRCFREFCGRRYKKQCLNYNDNDFISMNPVGLIPRHLLFVSGNRGFDARELFTWMLKTNVDPISRVAFTPSQRRACAQVEAMSAASVEQKKSVVLVIKDGLFNNDFVTSLAEVLQAPKGYTLRTYITNSDYYDSDTRRFCEENGASVLIFVQPCVGFSSQAINALVSDCSELQGAHTCIAVPRPERSFTKVLTSLKRRGIDAFDERELESLTSIFDINVKDKRIHLDEKGRFECDGFQPHDIVCIPLATVTEGVQQSSIKKMVHTKFTTSNSGVRGCLLDHLRNI